MQTKTPSKKKDNKAKKKISKTKTNNICQITIDHYVKEQQLLTYLFHEEFLKYENQLLHYCITCIFFRSIQGLKV